ncbi:unnamed protein product, partial [Microthlaspi erraticum]
GEFGRLGHGNSRDLFTPLPIKEFHGILIKQIACGDSHCLIVTMEGERSSAFSSAKTIRKSSGSKFHSNSRDMDRISELSDELLIEILSRLPTKDAISTCKLSKRWKCLWMYLPKLDYGGWNCDSLYVTFCRVACMLADLLWS